MASSSHSRNRTGTFIGVFIALCALTALSFGISQSTLMEDKMIGWTAMMAVSVAKASLVIAFFMHLWWEKAWKYALTLPAILMGGVLVILLIPDIAMRTNYYSKSRMDSAAAADAAIDNSPNSETSENSR